MSEKMKNMQLTLSDESIDSFIEQLKTLKKNNNTVIRLGGGKDTPELIIIHKNFKVPKPKEEGLDE